MRVARMAQKEPADEPPFSISYAQEIGGILKEVRCRNNLSVKTVADALHVRRIYVEALEEGRLDVLPGIVYALGFLKNYARLLGLNPSEISACLEFNNTEDSLEFSKNLIRKSSSEKRLSSRFLICLTLLALLGFGSALWFRKGVSSEELSPPGDTSQDLMLPEAPQEKPDATALSDSVAPVEAKKGIEEAEDTYPPGITPSAPSLPSVPTETGTPPVSPLAFPPSPPTLLAQPAAKEETAPAPEITLKAREKTWVRIYDDNNKTIHTKVFLAGETYAVPKDQKLFLTVGNAGGLTVSFAETEMGILGTIGQVKKNIPLTKEALQENLSKE